MQLCAEKPKISIIKIEGIAQWIIAEAKIMSPLFLHNHHQALLLLHLCSHSPHNFLQHFLAIACIWITIHHHHMINYTHVLLLFGGCGGVRVGVYVYNEWGVSGWQRSAVCLFGTVWVYVWVCRDRKMDAVRLRETDAAAFLCCLCPLLLFSCFAISKYNLEDVYVIN